MRAPRPLAAAAALFLAVLPARADQILPPGRILGSDPANGDILFGALKLGKRQGGKTTLQPDTVQIQGPGSTGPVDGMDVTSLAGVRRTFAQRLLDRVVFEDLGGGPDKTPAENCTALAKPEAKGKTIYFNDYTYSFSCTIVPPLNDNGRPANLVGNGPDRTRLLQTTANLPTISLPTYSQYARIEGLTLDRSVTATAGGDGIVVGDNVSHITIRNVVSTNNYNGANLGTTDVSSVENLEATHNINNGVLLQNNDTTTQGGKPIQWNFTGRNILSYNNVDGLRIQANPGSLPAGTSEIVLGELTGISTAGNLGSGISAYGASNLPISDFRLSNHFIGGDAGIEVFLDTYGHSHSINGGFVEYSGTFCIYVTGNNSGVSVNGTSFLSCNKNAVYSDAPETTITGISAQKTGYNTAFSNVERATVYLGGVDSIVSGGVLSGGTYGVVTGAQRVTINAPVVTKTAVGDLAIMPDTIVRGVRGRADAN